MLVPNVTSSRRGQIRLVTVEMGYEHNVETPVRTTGATACRPRVLAEVLAFDLEGNRDLSEKRAQRGPLCLEEESRLRPPLSALFSL